MELPSLRISWLHNLSPSTRSYLYKQLFKKLVQHKFIFDYNRIRSVVTKVWQLIFKPKSPHLHTLTSILNEIKCNFLSFVRASSVLIEYLLFNFFFFFGKNSPTILVCWNSKNIYYVQQSFSTKIFQVVHTLNKCYTSNSSFHFHHLLDIYIILQYLYDST